MSTKSKYPITRRDFLKLGLLLPFSFLLDRFPSFLKVKATESPPAIEAWDPWEEILPLVAKREEFLEEEALAPFTMNQGIITQLITQFPLKGTFERKILHVLLKNHQDFWQESIWYPEASFLLLRSEFATPFRSKERRCGLRSEVRLHWIDETTQQVYTPFVASNGVILYQQTHLSPVVLSSNCPGNMCTGYCDYTCSYPLPPQGDRFCRSMPCVSSWWCLIQCGLECLLCIDFCQSQKWSKCIACAIANCGCGQCFSRRWVCDVCP